MLAPLNYPPGIFRNGTRYQSKARWYDANLVRHFDGAWRPVGGWIGLKNVVAGTVYGLDTCTDANGTAVTSHVPDSGFSGWEGGIGAFALGASIQSNKIERTSVGGGTQTQHNFTATTLPFDNVEYMVDLTRPADASNQQGGFFFRGNGQQYSGVTNDGVYVYWDRVSSTLVDLKLRVQKQGVDGQQVTALANYAWSASTEQCLGVTISGASVQIWTAAAGSGQTASARTNRGNAITLTPDTFNDASHRRYGAWLRQNATAYRFDNFRLKAADVNTDVTFGTGICRKLFAWRSSGNQPHLAIGTNSKIYTFKNGAVTDITPSDFVAGSAEPSSTQGPYNTGNYNAGPYGVGDVTQAQVTDPASWQLDNFGNQLVGVSTSDGRLLVSADGVTQMTAATNAPVSNVGVVVTPERFVVLLGAGGDPRKLQWADQESLTSWTPAATNAAGDFPLPGSGKLLCGRRGRNETLVWTDEDVFALQYVGGTLVYAVNQVGSRCGLVSPHAVAVMDNKAIWMGQRSFYVYDGFTRTLELEVSDYVFSDFNRTMRAKCWAVTLAAFGEIWFFYPSASSGECDRYVIYNYVKDHATIGKLTRTAGIDRGVFDFPMMADSTTVIEHEKGTTMSGAGTPYLEGGVLQIGNGDNVMRVVGFIPDEATSAGQQVGSTRAYLYTSFRPAENEVQNGPYTLASKTDLRLSARFVRLRLEEIVRGDWRLGEVSLDAKQGGLR